MPLISNGDGTATDDFGETVRLTVRLTKGAAADRFVASSRTSDQTQQLAATVDAGPSAPDTGTQGLGSLAVPSDQPSGLSGIFARVQAMSSGKKAALGLAALLAVWWLTDDADGSNEDDDEDE